MGEEVSQSSLLSLFHDLYNTPEGEGQPQDSPTPEPSQPPSRLLTPGTSSGTIRLLGVFTDRLRFLLVLCLSWHLPCDSLNDLMISSTSCRAVQPRPSTARGRALRPPSRAQQPAGGR